MSSINTLTAKQLHKAAKLKERIDGLEKKLAKVLGSTPDVAVADSKPVKKRKKNKMSAAGRARIAAAQKARWAAVRARKK